MAGGGAVRGGEGRRELRLRLVGVGDGDSAAPASVVRACRREELDLPHILLRRRLVLRRSLLPLPRQERVSLRSACIASFVTLIE